MKTDFQKYIEILLVVIFVFCVGVLIGNAMNNEPHTEATVTNEPDYSRLTVDTCITDYECDTAKAINYYNERGEQCLPPIYVECNEAGECFLPVPEYEPPQE